MAIPKKMTDTDVAKMSYFEKLSIIISWTPEHLLIGTDQGRRILLDAIQSSPADVKKHLKDKFLEMYPDGGRGKFTATERAAIKGFRQVGEKYVERWL